MSRRLGTLEMSRKLAGRSVRRRATVAVAVVTLAVAVSGFAGAKAGEAATGAPWAPGHVLLEFKPDASPALRLRIAHAVGGHRLRPLGPRVKPPRSRAG